MGASYACNGSADARFSQPLAAMANVGIKETKTHPHRQLAKCDWITRDPTLKRFAALTKDLNMYKTPELSKMAKALRSELVTKGLNLSHAQALELAAKTTGHRTLHVAQAQAANAPSVNLEEFAQREAAAQMFTSLGRFDGKVSELMDGIRAAFDLDESRETEHAVWKLMEDGNHPVLDSEIQDLYRVDQLPALFARKVTEVRRLTAVLGRETRLGPVDGPEEVLFRGPMRDWLVHDDPQAELLDRQKRVFQGNVTRNGSQVYVEVSLPYARPDELDGTDQMGLFIEVNRGVPCVHITNSIFGDQVLSVFATKEGLYLRPDSSMHSIRAGLPNEGTMRELAVQDRGPCAPWNDDAFIESSNAG